MKNVYAARQPKGTATFYVCVYGDIFDTAEEAEITGLAGTVTVDGFFVGSMDEMRRAALSKYNA